MSLTHRTNRNDDFDINQLPRLRLRLTINPLCYLTLPVMRTEVRGQADRLLLFLVWVIVGSQVSAPRQRTLVVPIQRSLGHCDGKFAKTTRARSGRLSGKRSVYPDVPLNELTVHQNRRSVLGHLLGKARVIRSSCESGMCDA